MEEYMGLIMLESLPHAYEHFIEILNTATMNVDLKFEELSNKLSKQNKWKKEFGSNNETEGVEQVFATKSRAKTSGQRKKTKAVMSMQPRL